MFSFCRYVVSQVGGEIYPAKYPHILSVATFYPFFIQKLGIDEYTYLITLPTDTFLIPSKITDKHQRSWNPT